MSETTLHVLAGLAIFGPFLALGIWVTRYWARRSRDLEAVAARLGARFRKTSPELPQGATGFGVGSMGLGRLASNVLEGTYEGTEFVTFDLTVVRRRNQRTLHTVGCFGSPSEDRTRFLVTKGRGAYEQWPVSHLNDLQEQKVPAALDRRGVAVRANGSVLEAFRLAEKIADHFEESQNASRSPDGAWFVEGSGGRVLLLYSGQCCPPAQVENFIRDGCALARLRVT